MKFGVRECANIVFRAKTPMNIGKYQFKTGQTVLFIDTATTSYKVVEVMYVLSLGKVRKLLLSQ